MVTTFILILFISTIQTHRARTVEQSISPLFNSTTKDNTVISVPMQSIVLPCKAIAASLDPEQVMWYKLTETGYSTLSVGKHLITKDPRLSVAHYSVDHGISPALWDLHIRHVRLSDAADYQCHCIFKNNRYSSRSTIKLIIQDILVDIQPIDVRLSLGESAFFSCHFTGQDRFKAKNIIWLKDGKFVKNDSTRVITTADLNNMTMSSLQIINSQSNDSGSYRCFDGHHALSREAKLYIKDVNDDMLLLGSISSSLSSIACLWSYRTVILVLMCTISSFDFKRHMIKIE